MDYWQHFAEAMAIFFANLPGGTRPPLNEEQQAALNRYHELRKKACLEITRGANEGATAWGWRVHKRFNELVKAERNPKMSLETG